MKHLIIRPIQNSHIIQFYDGSQYFKSDIDLFKQLESKFKLSTNIKQIEYHPEVLHEVIYFDGTVENLSLLFEEYDNYINNVNNYNQLKNTLEESTNQPSILTLEEAKSKIKTEIYRYASNLLSNLTSQYSSIERDRWAIIIKEASAYSNSGNKEDAPNLIVQEQIRNPKVDITSEEFTILFTSRVNSILNKNTELTNSINHICGVRGKWIDLVNSFKSSTGKEAVDKLLSLNWKQGWN